MKPSKILDIMDLTEKVRKQGNTFNPLFVGPPGVAKSDIVKQWAKKRNIPLIDLRAAFLEAPDVIGYPSITITKDCRSITTHNTPEFWPFGGEGVLFLDEVNRGQPSVLNAFMQVLTDRRVHNYKLPEGWLIVSCINPENEDYDVSTMDPALKDRFEIFEVEYDKQDFVQYMKDTDWDASVVAFVETGTFKYIKPGEIGKTAGNKYLSPRTLSKLNAALKAGIGTSDLEQTVYEGILGKNVGLSFYHFKNNEQPVTFEELLNPKTFRMAIEKIRILSNPENYKMGSIQVTVNNVLENEDRLHNDLLASILLALPADAGPKLVNQICYKRGDKECKLLKTIPVDYPSVKKYWKNVINQ